MCLKTENCCLKTQTKHPRVEEEFHQELVDTHVGSHSNPKTCAKGIWGQICVCVCIDM